MKKDFKLSDLHKHNIYEVPDKYFDRLPMRIMERTATAKQPGFVSKPLGWVRLAIAPLVLLLVFAGVFFFNASEQKAETANFAALQNTDIINYLSSSQETIESTDFAELSALERHDLPADFLNVTPAVAEQELEYHDLDHIEY